MQEATLTRTVSVEEGYRRWSENYDSQPNPMLSLEQRYVNALLPEIKGKDVVDLGCGTGRWLQTMASRSPRTLTGIDSSASMLSRAAAKLRGSAILIEANCEGPCIKPESADLILCSFVLSYISEVDRIAGQIRRIARDDADIFVTDVHPETARKLGWSRGFRNGDSRVQIESQSRDIASILSIFWSRGFTPVVFLEIPFGNPEFSILNNAGKSNLIDEIRSHPAIYILQLKLQPSHGSPRDNQPPANEIGRIVNCRVAIGATEAFRGGLDIQNGRIASLHSTTAGCAETQACAIDLSGFLVMPGLINSHDHLEFALFPRLGTRRYSNFCEWAADIYKPDVSPVREHRAVPKETRLWWGAIRNLLSGVTTVCHHNPYVPDVFENYFPVRVLREFGWAHSIPIDTDFPARHAATPPGYPFIMHVAEGVDRRAAEELGELDRQGVLDERTVIVHGLALTDPAETALINSRGAAVIWCPTSNSFLFGSTHCRANIQALLRVALGSDSSLTACGDLLDEIRFAREEVGVSAERLYSQVGLGATEILRLRCGEGHLRAGGVADLIAIRDTGVPPAEALASISYRDIELVVVDGVVKLASETIRARLAPDLLHGLERLTIDGEVRWIRAPLARLFESVARVLGSDLRMNGRRLNRDLSA